MADAGKRRPRRWVARVRCRCASATRRPHAANFGPDLRDRDAVTASFGRHRIWVCDLSSFGGDAGRGREADGCCNLAAADPVAPSRSPT